jgi:hypothetical protein
MKDYRVTKVLNTDSLLVLNSVVLTFVVIWKISWGFSAPGILDGLYEVQARSLAQGHAYLIPGPPEVYYHDSSMFHGHAYLYFGPLPSLIFLLWDTLFGRFWAHYITTSLFVCCVMYFFQKLIAEVVDAALQGEPGRSSWWRLSSLGLLWCFLFAPPFPAHPFNLFCPDLYIYQQQILFAMGLAMAGMLALARGKPLQKTGAIAIAGLACALAASVRATWLLAAGAVLGVALILLIVKLIRYGRKAIAPWEGTCVVAGVSVLGVLLVWNFIRFGALSDFGVFFRQNCADDNMFRLSTGFFSWESKVQSFVVNLMAYYTSPDILDATGLAHTAFSYNGFPFEGFFVANPQWLLVLAVMPLSVYRVFTTKRALLPIFSVLLLAAVYINVIVAGVPPATGPRYFTEFYFLVILTFFAGLLAVLPARAGILSMIALLSLHFLHGGLAGTCTHPNLRLLDSGPLAPLGLNASFNRDPALDMFIVSRAHWPKGTFDAQDSSTLAPYHAMGIYPAGTCGFNVLDVAAVYIIPGNAHGNRGAARDGVLQLHDMRASGTRGIVKVFLEGLLLGSLRIYPDRNVDGVFNVPLRLEDNLPYQIMMVFLPDGRTYLPPHPPPVPPWQLGGLSLQRTGGETCDSARTEGSSAMP